MKLVIAEKPDAARKMASFLGAKTNQSGYIEGAGYIFTWGFGHLAELCPPEVYGFSEKWRMDALPMLPEKFKIRPAADKVAQVKIIQSLITRKDVDTIINACDPDREGELIFRYIMELAGSIDKSIQRVWLSTFTEADVKKAFSSPAPAGQYDNLGAAGRARSEADWLVGMNGTRAMTARTGSMVSIGRVQTPTLAIVCARYLSNKNFKPVPYYTVRLTLEKDGTLFTATTAHINEKAKAESINQAVSATSTTTVTKVETKERVENPPLLLDLTELQKEANKHYKLTAAETDAIAQKLYEAGIMSYPRTDSRFIGENMFAEIPKFLKLCAEFNQDFHAAATKYAGITLHNNCVDDKKVTGHHALLPTLEATASKVTALSEVERKVFYLIVRRMYEAFYMPCKKDITNAILLAANTEFYAKGVLIKEAGWRGLFKEPPRINEEDMPEQEQEQQLPALREQELLPIKSANLLENKTKPEPLFTEASLISFMKTCGKELDDEALKKALNNVEGIGRPATRSGIIEILIKRKFIAREKGKIIPTLVGLAIYNLVKGMKVSQVLLTAEWEAKLDRIAAGEFSYNTFMRDINAYIRSIIDEVKSLQNIEIVNQAAAADKILCPKCKKAHLRIFEKGIGCSNKECKFVVWRSICGKNLTDNQLSEIAKGKLSGIIKGFVSPKTGKSFEARLKLKADLTGVEFVFNKK
jgi:DNA topoisomerase-3